MADTTIDKVRAIADHLDTLDDEQIQIYIDDAKLELSEYGYDSKYEEKLQRYFAAHLATLQVRRPQKESISDMSVTYGSTRSADESTNFEMTKYGKELKRLLSKDAGPNLVLYS